MMTRTHTLCATLMAITGICATCAAQTQAGTDPAAGSIVEPVADTVFQDCATCPEMVIIPPGAFMMGSEKNPSKPNHAVTELERPVHLVTINYSFAVGRYPVTFDEWDACVADGGCDGYSPDHIGWRGPEEPGWRRGKRPVFRVNYEDAQLYLTWLSGKTGGSYRLLSEAEWEYMARAGTATEYNTGDTITQDHAKFTDKKTNYARKEGNWEVKMVPVGSFPPNAFGVYDVHGGITERVKDCWHPSYNGAPADGSTWITNGDCEKRVLRGSSWNTALRGLRIAARKEYPIRQRSVSVGFRVAKTLSPLDPNDPGSNQ